MRQFLLASAAAMVMAGAANAAEPLLEPLPPAPPVVVEPFVVPAWAGPYIGADIGWGWADIGDDDDNGLFDDDDDDDDFFDDDGLFDDDDDDDGLDGPVGGVFAGWLGQSGTFLYGVELFAQIGEIDSGDDDDDGDRLFDDIFDDDDEFFVDDGECFVRRGTDVDEIDCHRRGSDLQVHALGGLEGMIGWGGDRSAFLLHAGPALGWFQDEDDGRMDSGNDDFDRLFANEDDGEDIELGISAAAEGRFKLTERVFAGVIGRAFWFPNVGDDNDNGLFNGDDHHDDDDDITVFEVKARLGVMFGQPAAAAPVGVAY